MRRRRRTAKCNLISVCVAVRYLSNSVGILFQLGGFKTLVRNLRDYRIEIIYEKRIHSMARMLRLLDYVKVAVLGNRPNRFRVMWKERGR